MNRTSLRIEADGFCLCCPNCEQPIEEIEVSRLYEIEIQCFECLQSCSLVVTLER